MGVGFIHEGKYPVIGAFTSVLYTHQAGTRALTEALENGHQSLVRLNLLPCGAPPSGGERVEDRFSRVQLGEYRWPDREEEGEWFTSRPVVNKTIPHWVATLGVMTLGQTDPAAADLYRASSDYLAARARRGCTLEKLRRPDIELNTREILVMPDYDHGTTFENQDPDFLLAQFTTSAQVLLDALEQHRDFIDQTTGVYLGFPCPSGINPNLWIESRSAPTPAETNPNKPDLWTEDSGPVMRIKFLHNIPDNIPRVEHVYEKGLNAARNCLTAIPESKEHLPILYLIEFICDLFFYHYLIKYGNSDTTARSRLPVFLTELRGRLETHSMLTPDWEKAIGFWKANSTPERTP